MKSHTRLLAAILMITTIASTTGCSKQSKAEGKTIESFAIECNGGIIIDNSILENSVVEVIPTQPIEEVGLPNETIEHSMDPDVLSDKEKNIEEILKEH